MDVHQESLSSSPAVPEIPESAISDPPPPYPQPKREGSRRHHGGRTSRGVHGRITSQGSSSQSHHTQMSSTETDYDAPISPYADEDDDVGLAGEGANETTLLLSPSSRGSRLGYGHGRARSHSYTSTMSGAPSLAHTVLSLFQEPDEEADGRLDGHLSSSSADEIGYSVAGPSGEQQRHQAAGRGGKFTSWRRYFRPLARKAYWKPLFHLAVVNFPYALAAWVYLFVFTVTGTTLLVALPLGAVLCFFNLLGARAFARGELALQTCFHAPLAHALPYPPRPLFTRYREPTSGEVELLTGRLVKEKSFYKNTYAMFTDPTSYQALFYFLVIKPAITLLIALAIVALGIPLCVLVLPAPAVLRAIRKVGIWQANVAVEGLYYAVR